MACPDIDFQRLNPSNRLRDELQKLIAEFQGKLLRGKPAHSSDFDERLGRKRKIPQSKIKLR